MADGTDDQDLIAPRGGHIQPHDIREEMQTSYLTYAMSVIISRALPDVRDGLKPSQRRILVAMNDLNLGPNSGRKKCAKIAGDTSGNYHPHGEGSVYPTLVRMGQDWTMRQVLIDKQGNFGSLAGLPPAAMRYTEARLSSLALELLRDIDRNTVDYVPTYDQENLEPVVLPSRFPNLLVNGSSGIAVGMATSIPPHNLGEVCSAVKVLIDNPNVGVDEILAEMPGPDFPTGGTICGHLGIRQAYMTGRSTITLRAKTHFETEKNSDVIVVTEIPFMETRDRIREKLEQVVRDEKVKGISRIVDLTDRNIPTWQVRLHIVLKKDADPDVVLNQLYQYSPLQSTVSMILLALVGNRPQVMSIKDMLQEFILHRVDVIRRRTEYLLSEARKRKHTVEGLMIAQIDIDQVIQTIRDSPSRNEAKVRLQDIEVPGELIARALGEDGFRVYQEEQGEKENYSLSTNQAEAIVSMQLGSLANLEREKLSDEFAKLLEDITEYVRILSDESNIRSIIREDMDEIIAKYDDKRRTDISDEELTQVDKADLIAEEPMVVTLSKRGYIKRTQLSVYQAQNRGGKGIKGAKSDDEDAIQHLFVASTHDYLLFFTDHGKVHWQKVYDLPLQNRTAKGRAVVNILQVDEGASIYNCLAVRDFEDDRYLIMATKKGIVKKTSLSAYSRPMKGGIIAIKLDDDDELIDVRIVSDGEDIVIGTSTGMCIRFAHDDARPMGRNTRGVKGISLKKDDYVVGMVTTQEDGTLLSVCENGYGKRTPFGVVADEDDDDADEVSSTMRYRRQKRGGKGVRDIRATKRNGKVVDILSITDDDDILMVTSKGKIQRIHGKDISVIGRNTQGVRLIRLDDGDTLAGCAPIPGELSGDEDEDLGGPAVAPVESESTESADVESDDEDAAGEEE
ncbi:MAG: DNA gyrase subunit A [Planctomycetaceae bacterium]|nr:DNA gyrase subunit A [Planctomycetaceae bacterium]